MARVVITEFMDERAVAQLRAKHDVLFDARLVDDMPRLLAEARGAEALVVRNRTQVRGALLAALANGRESTGKTLGLIGFGSIGQLTATLARGVGMEVIAFDAMMDDDHPAYAAHAVRSTGLDEVIRTADVVSLHVPLVESTRGLLNAERIAGMKKGAVLVNTARGGVVDELALSAALRSGQLGGAALDVFAQEPLPASPHFDGCPNLVLTPHIAGVSAESNERVSFLIAQKVLEALA